MSMTKIASQKGFTIIEVYLCLRIIASLALTGLLLYAAIHFAVKYW